MVSKCAGLGLLTAAIVIVIIGRQKLSKPTNYNSPTRSCLSSDERNKRKKKKVHFAVDMAEPRDRKIPARILNSESQLNGEESIEKREHKIPANRIALYNGIMSYRMQQASLHHL